jgi:uncharacterized protein with PIN domain
MDLTQKDLDEIAEEFKKAAISTERCHYCNRPVYRLPFQEAIRVDEKIMCLDCMSLYAEYKKIK